MVTEIIMPKAGMAMEEGTIIRWCINEGEQVKQGDVLLEIETDKVNMEVEADVSGYLIKTLFGPGAVVPVTNVIGYIADKADEKVPEGGAAAAATAAEAKEEAPAVSGEGKDFDVIVIGGGPAGYIAALKVAELGGRAALVEKDTLGGTCLNRGCIPTKAYLESAKLLEKIAHGESMGVSVQGVKFDMAAARENKDRIVKKLTGGVAALLKDRGVTVIKGFGEVDADKNVTVDGKVYSAASVIYAGGSVPVQLPLPGMDLEGVVTSNEMLACDDIPEKLVIIGGGVIGLELACAFNSFGSSVTVVEMLSRIAPNLDDEVAGELRKKLENAGIAIKTGVKFNGVRKDGNALVAETSEGDLAADKVLVAVGRKPDIAGIEKAGVATERGRVIVDDGMRTSVPGIYCPGDANGRLMLAHTAFRMAEVAAENAMGMKSVYDGSIVPSCVYTFPEAAGVGLTEAQARAKGEIAVGRFNLAANGRALAGNAGEGFVKVIADKKYGEILGVHIIGMNATEMIAEAAVMLHMEMDAEEVIKIIHAHPTTSEAVYEAAADVLGRSLHSMKK